MPQKTNLNVAPYYDDFNESDNFVRTLFRPGFAIQARELTQLQSVLQNQLEQGFSHIFTDGTMIIPGQVTYSGGKDALRYVKLASTISGENLVTGATSGATGTPDAGADSAVTLAGGNTITFTNGYANPEMAADSGDIIYIENRKPISRSSDQIEDIKVIVEF